MKLNVSITKFCIVNGSDENGSDYVTGIVCAWKFVNVCEPEGSTRDMTLFIRGLLTFSLLNFSFLIESSALKKFRTPFDSKSKDFLRTHTHTNKAVFFHQPELFNFSGLKFLILQNFFKSYKCWKYTENSISKKKTVKYALPLCVYAHLCNHRTNSMKM